MSRKRLADFLKSNEITRNDLASLLGVSQTWVAGLVRGLEPVPAWVHRICILFDAADMTLRKSLLAEASAEPQWRTIAAFPNYEVSELGEVRRGIAHRQRMPAAVLKHKLDQSGYPKVGLYDEAGKQRHVQIHRLVALAFLGQPPHGRPYACHRDGNKLNARADNLYWGTPKENAADRQAHSLLKRSNRPYTGTYLTQRAAALVAGRPEHVVIAEENLN